MLALVALGVVSRLRREWLAVELQDAARAEQVSEQRLSRLVTRAVVAFEATLAVLTRRGRPPRRDAERDVGAELALTRELLAVTTALLARIEVKRRDARDLVVGAWQRLRLQAGMTQRRFCEALALPDRTLRAWLARPVAPSCASPRVPPQAPPPKPPRPPRRRRFGFDFTLPGTQVGADTTDLEVFGVPLKLIAAQDIGGRDASLFDAVLVDDHESAELVVSVLAQALAGKEGAQAITDQGTPYLAKKTRDALSELGVEHAPQKEGDPCGKSTVERAFGSLKSIAAPIISVLKRVSDAVPALRDVALAKAAATLVVTALLRAYQHGARAARAADTARGGIDADTLAQRAEETRERARADDHSRRLLLGNLHALYALPGSAQVFINAFAKVPIEVLRDAERAFQSQVHRDDIRDRKSYFGAIVRKYLAEHRIAVLRDVHHQRDASLLAREQAERDAQRASWRSDPAQWLRDALALLAVQWDARAGALLFDGAGLGLGMVTAALRHIFGVYDARSAEDLVAGVLHGFHLASRERLGADGVAAVTALVERQRDVLRTRAPTVGVALPERPAILAPTGQKPRPPPSARLPILAA